MKKLLVAGVCLGLAIAAAPAMGADRNLAPTKSISGDSSRISTLADLGVGPDGTVYGPSPSDDRLFAYAPTASSNATPVRSIGGAGPKTLLNTPDVLAVDPQGRLWTRLSFGTYSIGVFPGNFNGTVAPIKTIGGENTGLAEVGGIGIGPNGDVYVTERSTDSVLVFDAFAGGNVEPKRIIQGGNTQLSSSSDIKVDAVGNVYVLESAADKVLVFANGAGGNVPPTRTIAGPATNFTSPSGIALDSGRNLYVADASTGAVSVFGPTANGDVVPFTRLVGISTGLDTPAAVAVGVDRRVYVLDGFVDAIRVFAPLVPFVKAGPVRALKVLGTAGAAVRKITWATPATNLNAGAITGYRVVITQGTRVILTKVVGPGVRALSVARTALKKGTLTAKVAAVNKQGLGAIASKTFKVS